MTFPQGLPGFAPFLLFPSATCSLDTGRLNPETYRLFDAVEKHYKIRIEYTFPEANEVTDLVRAKGLFSFYEDGHTECCRIRKVCQAMPSQALLSFCCQMCTPSTCGQMCTPPTCAEW